MAQVRNDNGVNTVGGHGKEEMEGFEIYSIGRTRNTNRI